MSTDEPAPEVMAIVDRLRPHLSLNAADNTTALTFLLIEITLKAPKPNREILAKTIANQVVGKVMRNGRN